MRSKYRKIARPIIREAIERTRGQPAKDVRRAIRKAYPFGARYSYKYSVWLDEVKLQLGKKLPPGVDPQQLSLFTF